MNLDRYTYTSNKTNLDYEFVSRGPKGAVKKVVRFLEIEDGIYNLGFGDLDERIGNISDLVATNNADTEKVLATVAMIADDFTKRYPGAIIAMKGSTKSRTRLYQINISKYWKEIYKTFKVQGLINGKWELFRNGINYDAFAAQRHGNSSI